ncbi:MAG: hypothetical protein EOR72_32470 [Mesorhizobium sp.]|nr:MAG: hypothetical protein EOR72_32470 [Mesorhizobium sp.]
MAATSEMAGNDDAKPEPPVETSPKLDRLRRSRRKGCGCVGAGALTKRLPRLVRLRWMPILTSSGGWTCCSTPAT